MEQPLIGHHSISTLWALASNITLVGRSLTMTNNLEHNVVEIIIAVKKFLDNTGAHPSGTSYSTPPLRYYL